MHRLGRRAQGFENQLDALLLKGWGIQQFVRDRLHARERHGGARDIPPENIVQLEDRNEPWLARPVGVLEETPAWIFGHRLPERLGAVQNNGPQVHLGKRIGGQDIEVVSHVLIGVVEVGDVN
jgi:hypothetical protein